MSDTSDPAPPAPPPTAALTRAEWFKFALAFGLLLQNGVVITLVLLGVVVEDKNGLAFAIVTGCSSALGVALGYFFGASAGASSSTQQTKKGP